MSTLNVNRIVDASGGVMAPISSVFKNRIINGAMVIDQRNAGASITPTVSAFTLDRWVAEITQGSKFSVEQTIAGVAAPVGFTDYLGVTSTSAYSVLTGDTFLIRQTIEGFNIADLGWGTANAKTVTLSFWVRSSLTGTFGGALVNGAATFRSYPYSYVISAANTWEYKTITIAGDTSGTWNTTNGAGIFVRFGLGSGSTFSGTAGAWATGNFVQPTGTVSVVGTNGATFYITGVQLERGTQATSFEHRQYQQELALCQRYYSKSYNTSVVPGTVGNDGAVSTSSTATAAGGVITSFGFPVEMRASPTMTFYSSVTGDSGVWQDAGSATNKTVATYTAAGTRGGTVYNTAAWSAVGTGAYGHWVASIEI